MKRLLLLLFFGCMFLVGSAQTDNGDENAETKLEERIEKIKTELALTPDQVSKLRIAMTKQLEDLKAEKLKIREAEKEMREINKVYHNELSSFLSENQMEQLKSIKTDSEDRQERENTNPKSKRK